MQENNTKKVFEQIDFQCVFMSFCSRESTGLSSLPLLILFEWSRFEL